MKPSLESSEPWNPISKATFSFATLFALGIAYLSNTGERWVPIIDGANLLFHEAGHPIFGILSERLMVYGGTLGQLTFPLVTIYYFWKERKPTSFFICITWLVQNFWNIARYMADARTQVLPLVGNGDRLHDWAEILGRWGLLASDQRFSSQLSFWAGALLASAWWWFLQEYRKQNELNQ